MPKAEVGTPKWLANKMKAKGLQKLRWWCEMCQKQCRDENGFKCHRMSEAHQRQMQIFASCAGKFIDEFSRDFERSFMRLMQTTYCRTRVLANTVYQDVISNKLHVHMNATCWVTLSEFVQYLARSGKCKIERADDRGGWYIEYIDREKIKRDEEADKKRRADITEEERNTRRLAEAVAAARARGEYDKNEANDDDQNPGISKEELGAISIQMPKASTAVKDVPLRKDPPAGADGGEPPARNPLAMMMKSSENGTPNEPSDAMSMASFTTTNTKRKLSALDRLMLENERKKRRQLTNAADDTAQPAARKSDHTGGTRHDISGAGPSARRSSVSDDGDEEIREETIETETEDDEPWILRDIVVRVIDRKLANGKYFKKVGIVKEIAEDDEHVAQVEMCDGGQKLRMDEEFLEPVVSGCGKEVVIVKGSSRGRKAIVLSVDSESLLATVKMRSSSSSEIKKFAFDEICKTSAK